MKKLFCFFIAVCLIVSLKTQQNVYADNDEIYLLGNAECVQILEHNNMYKKVPIASLTKLMTAYICYNKISKGEISFNDKVFVSKTASEAEPSKAYLIEDNCYSLQDIFKAMLIKSANDCAIAIAEHISGSEKAFSELMNITATQIGMKSTNYTNASGLSTPNQHSTAYDQYLLFHEILKIDEIVNILKTDKMEFNNGEKVKTLFSTNKLIPIGIIGKTGYTIEAQNCFCGCNFNDENKFIFITFGNETSEQRFSKVKNSINNAISEYNKEIIVSCNVKNKKFQLAENDMCYANETDFSVLIKKGEKCPFNVIENFYSFNKFPIKNGDIVGESLVIFNNKIIKRVNLIAKNKVERISIFTNIKRIVQS